MEALCEAHQRSVAGLADGRFSGIFHWQANDRQTKYSMGMAIAEIAGLDTKHLVRVDDAPAPGSAPRPQFERMLCTRLEGILSNNGYQPDNFRCNFKLCLARHLQPFLQSKI